ncbi:MAG: hypothetical protein HWN81_07570 [Candidatus Lokiarchaeota archaeon]|nr:hypothetical protein [Candidatus Lokiarchaeota archaeon]
MSKNPYILFIIGIISLLIIFLTPYCFEIDLTGTNRFLAILWEYGALGGFRWFTVFQYVPIYFFRFITLYYVIKYIMGVVSRKKVIIISIISELIPLLISIPGALLKFNGEYFLPIMISIPILLLYNLILTFIFSNRKLNIKELKSI